jgi:hypothetical protein
MIYRVVLGLEPAIPKTLRFAAISHRGDRATAIVEADASFRPLQSG